MWREITFELPPEVAKCTTSVWSYPEIVILGVMKSSFFAPPWLWAKVLNGGFCNVRKSPSIINEFQILMNLPKVYAEAEIDKPRNQRLLEFLGFVYEQSYEDRKIYTRSI